MVLSVAIRSPAFNMNASGERPVEYGASRGRPVEHGASRRRPVEYGASRGGRPVEHGASAMNSNDRSRRWLILCIVGGLVAGAGGLLPSLFNGDSNGKSPVEGSLSAGLASEQHTELSVLSAGPSIGAMLVRLAAGTVLVLALCAGTLSLLRRQIVTSPTEKSSNSFSIVTSLPLNSRCRVYLVRVDGQHLLAGMDAAGLQNLVPVGNVAAEDELPIPTSQPMWRTSAGIDPRRVGAA